MKIMSGELSPNTGHVSLDNKPIQEWPAKALAKRRAVLPQHAVLDFPFQVREVVALGRSPFRHDKARDAKVVHAALETFALGKYANRPYTMLSGGERQRVHLARVWAQISTFDTNKPSYLLLDEPTSALDLKYQRDLMLLLKNAVGEHSLGVVAALHDLNTAAYFADKLLLLKQGKLIASGSCDEVLTQANIEQVYELPIEFLRYQANGKQVIAIPTQAEYSEGKS